MSLLDPQARAAMLAELYPYAATKEEAEAMFGAACRKAMAARQHATPHWTPIDVDDNRTPAEQVAERQERDRRLDQRRDAFAAQRIPIELEPSITSWRAAWSTLCRCPVPSWDDFHWLAEEARVAARAAGPGLAVVDVPRPAPAAEFEQIERRLTVLASGLEQPLRDAVEIAIYDLKRARMGLPPLPEVSKRWRLAEARRGGEDDPAYGW